MRDHDVTTNLTCDCISLAQSVCYRFRLRDSFVAGVLLVPSGLTSLAPTRQLELSSSTPCFCAPMPMPTARSRSRSRSPSRYPPPVLAYRRPERETVCVICLEAFPDGSVQAATMACAHEFHGPCIRRWLYQRGTCPVCRSVHSFSLLRLVG